jgi:hypothetical protein
LLIEYALTSWKMYSIGEKLCSKFIILQDNS